MTALSHRSLPPDSDHRRSFRYWTMPEISRLRESYPARGIAGALDALPGRSAQAIYGKARQLGLRGPVQPNGRRGGRRVKYMNGPRTDEQIRCVYTGTPHSGAVNELARNLGRPRWWVCKRAAALGLVVPRFKEPPWGQDEDVLLEATAHLSTACAWRRFRSAGYTRSETAITVRRKRMHLRAEDNGYYTASGVALVLGVDSSTVAGWIEKGWLKARRRGTARKPQQGGDHWWINRRDLRAFIRDNAARVDLRKVDRLWFIDFAFGAPS